MASACVVTRPWVNPLDALSTLSSFRKQRRSRSARGGGGGGARGKAEGLCSRGLAADWVTNHPIAPVPPPTKFATPVVRPTPPPVQPASSTTDSEPASTSTNPPPAVQSSPPQRAVSEAAGDAQGTAPPEPSATPSEPSPAPVARSTSAASSFTAVSSDSGAFRRQRRASPLDVYCYMASTGGQTPPASPATASALDHVASARRKGAAPPPLAPTAAGGSTQSRRKPSSRAGALLPLERCKQFAEEAKFDTPCAKPLRPCFACVQRYQPVPPALPDVLAAAAAAVDDEVTMPAFERVEIPLPTIPVPVAPGAGAGTAPAAGAGAGAGAGAVTVPAVTAAPLQPVAAVPDILATATMAKRGRGFPWGWKPRFFVLHSRGEIMYYNKDPNAGGRLKGTLDLRPGFTIKDSTKKLLAFQLSVTTGDSLLIAPANESDRTTWIACLQQHLGALLRK